MPNTPWPAQRHRSETYRGVEISVSAFRKPAGWSWAYVVYGLTGHSAGAMLPTAEAALNRGMLAARARVDRP